MTLGFSAAITPRIRSMSASCPPASALQVATTSVLTSEKLHSVRCAPKIAAARSISDERTVPRSPPQPAGRRQTPRSPRVITRSEQRAPLVQRGPISGAISASSSGCAPIHKILSSGGREARIRAASTVGMSASAANTPAMMAFTVEDTVRTAGPSPEEERSVPHDTLFVPSCCLKIGPLQ